MRLRPWHVARKNEKLVISKLLNVNVHKVLLLLPACCAEGDLLRKIAVDDGDALQLKALIIMSQ